MPKTEIRYEYRGAMASTVGRDNGLSEAAWAALGKEAAAAVRRVNAVRASTPYRDLPTNKKISEIGEVLASVRKKAGRFDEVVVMGIGGSALGLTCLKTALRPPYWNIIGPRGRKGLPRLWVMDNVDPDEFTAMLEAIDPRRTLFNIISKSGETSETMSQFLVALDLVRECIGRDWRQHVVITTDRSKGILRPVAEAEGLESFIVPDGVGGRFSVMSPVGLFPAAMIGIDVKGLLAGAAAMDKVCSSASFAANPAAQGAAVQVGLYRRGKPLSVMMPYSAALKDVADWYCQLWAESLGKVSPAGRFVGPTPIKALGVTDQHSQVQLYREGPADKVFTILAVEKFTNEVPLPDGPESLKGLEFLSGHSMKELLKAEEQATAWAMASISRRPVTKIVLGRVTPQNVGGLLHLLMVQTSIAGEMLGINPYNQPGVEAGKQATFALMGKAGNIKNPAAVGLPADCKTYAILRRKIQAGSV